MHSLLVSCEIIFGFEHAWAKVVSKAPLTSHFFKLQPETWFSDQQNFTQLAGNFFWLMPQEREKQENLLQDK